MRPSNIPVAAQISASTGSACVVGRLLMADSAKAVRTASTRSSAPAVTVAARSQRHRPGVGMPISSSAPSTKPDWAMLSLSVAAADSAAVSSLIAAPSRASKSALMAMMP